MNKNIGFWKRDSGNYVSPGLRPQDIELLTSYKGQGPIRLSLTIDTTKSSEKAPDATLAAVPTSPPKKDYTPTDREGYNKTISAIFVNKDGSLSTGAMSESNVERLVGLLEEGGKLMVRFKPKDKLTSEYSPVGFIEYMTVAKLNEIRTRLKESSL